MNQRELFLRHVAQTSDNPMLGQDIDIESAHGSVLTARDGKKYFDLISGISVSSVGHCHPQVVKAVKEQAGKFMHLMVYGEFNQSPQVKYAELLSSLLPSPLDSVFFTTGGSEAVEGALKLAKRATGRTGIINFRNAYHGSTHGALSVMGDEFFRNAYRPLLPGITTLEFNNPDQLHLITNDAAAVIIEPVQGEAGIRAASRLFMCALRERCNETGVLLLADEIQTGFGRTGKLFAFEHYNIIPDILITAKGMGGGLPIGAFTASRDLMKHLSFGPPLGHINTFGGNAVCVAAALATLKIITNEKLADRAVTIGEMIRKRLHHSRIKELRINGALGAVDFQDEQSCMEVARRCIDAGVITDWFLFCPTAIRIAPPLNISERELDAGLEIMLSAIAAT